MRGGRADDLDWPLLPPGVAVLERPAAGVAVCTGGLADVPLNAALGLAAGTDFAAGLGGSTGSRAASFAHGPLIARRTPVRPQD